MASGAGCPRNKSGEQHGTCCTGHAVRVSRHAAALNGTARCVIAQTDCEVSLTLDLKRRRAMASQARQLFLLAGAQGAVLLRENPPALEELLEEAAQLGDADAGALALVQAPVQPVLQDLHVRRLLHAAHPVFLPGKLPGQVLSGNTMFCDC